MQKLTSQSCIDSRERNSLMNPSCASSCKWQGTQQGAAEHSYPKRQGRKGQNMACYKTQGYRALAQGALCLTHNKTHSNQIVKLKMYISSNLGSKPPTWSLLFHAHHVQQERTVNLSEL